MCACLSEFVPACRSEVDIRTATRVAYQCWLPEVLGTSPRSSVRIKPLNNLAISPVVNLVNT